MKNIYVHNEMFSIENGLLTPTLKAKRPELKEVFKERNFLLESGRRFHQLDLGEAPWSEIKKRLGKIDWDEIY